MPAGRPLSKFHVCGWKMMHPNDLIGKTKADRGEDNGLCSQFYFNGMSAFLISGVGELLSC